MLKKLGLIIIVMIIIGVVAVSIKSPKSPTKNNKPIIKIGVSLFMTGDMAYMGKALKGVVEIAQEDLKSQNLKNNYQFIIEDNAFDNKQIMAVNSKFINIDKVDAIIDFATKPGKLTNTSLKDKSIIHFNACASDASIAKGKYNFLHTTLPDKEAEKLAQMLKRKYQKPVIVALNEESSQISARYMQQYLHDIGTKAQIFNINPEERDMRLLIEKIEQSKPDVYIVMLYSPTSEIFIRQMKEKGIATPITSTQYFSNLNDLNLIEGAEYVDYAGVEGEMKKRIAKHNNRVSNYTMCNGNIYDIVMLLVSAFEKAPTKNRTVDELGKISKYDGVMGKVVANEDGVFQALPVKRIVKNGQAQLAE